MLYNGCQIITMGIEWQVKIFLKNAWLQKILGNVETLTIEKNKGQSLKKKKATCAKAQKRPDTFLDRHVKMCVCAEYRNTHKNTK